MVVVVADCGIPGSPGVQRETPSAGQGQPAPWRWDPMAAHRKLASLTPDDMAAARVAREKGGWLRALPTAGQERRFFFLIVA